MKWNKEEDSHARTYVIYHANCTDGFGAAYAIWKHVGGSATYLPCSYGDDVPDIEEGSIVYIVDFSFSRQQLLDLDARTSYLRVYDHHFSKKKEIGDLPFVVFSDDESGAVMAWKAFSTERVPLMLRYIQDWDLWQFAMAGSKEINTYYRSYPMSFIQWELMRTETETDTERVCNEGAAILRMADQIVENICRQTRFEEIGGYEIPVVNCTSHWSEVGHRLLELYPDAPFAGTYYDLRNGDMKWGLRGREGGVDVSEVAKKFGGGGHKQAAGFVW